MSKSLSNFARWAFRFRSQLMNNISIKLMSLFRGIKPTDRFMIKITIAVDQQGLGFLQKIVIASDQIAPLYIRRDQGNRLTEGHGQ